MDSAHPQHTSHDSARAAAYLAAKLRLDALPGKEGKTPKRSTNIHCNPPNKRCGNRCIPPNWNCRATGGGLDSHSKVVQFDPVQGVNNVVRGVKNVKKGIEKADPELVTRGLKGVERGITKLTPGEDLEKKQKFRKNVKNAVAITAGVAMAYLGGRSIHNNLKAHNKRYREGWGAQIDNAASRAANRFLDVTDRIPLIGSGRRAGAIASAESVATQLATGQAVAHQTRANLHSNPRDRNIFQARATLRSDVPGIGHVNGADTEARRNGWGFDQWQQTKAERLVDIRRPGSGPGSAYSQPAAHELLAARFGFQLPHRSVRSNEIAGEGDMVKDMLRGRVSAMHDDLVAGMRVRGLDPTTKEHRDRYVSDLMAASPLNLRGLDRQTQRNLDMQRRDQLTKLIGASNADAQRRYANNVYTNTVSMYDTYFARTAANVRRNAAAPDSPFGDVAMGLTRLHVSNGQGIRPVDRDHAQFQNRLYYHQNVMGQRGPLQIDRATAVRMAQKLQRSVDTPSPDAAERFLQSQGYNVRVPRARELFRGQAPRNTVLSEAAAITRYMRQNPGATREAAQRAIRTRRGDSPERVDALPPRIAAYLDTQRRLDSAKGKPCGKSYISSAKKCQAQGAPERSQRSASPEVAANKHDTSYHVRQFASAVARTGLTAGMGALAYKAYREGQTTNALYLTAGTMVGAASLLRETRTTHTAKQLAEGFEKLKSQPGVEPETIDKLKKFITETEMDSQRVGAVQVLMGLGGYFDTSMPDRIHVVAGGMKVSGAVNDKDPAAAYSNGVAKYMEERTKLSPRLQNAENITKRDDMLRNFTGSAYIGNSDGQRQYLLSHEIGHALHYRSNFASPNEVKVGGKTYSGQELTNELRRSTSVYGQSDIMRRKYADRDRDNYYLQGGRLETFSENFALYVANGKKMKELYPVSYAWTKATADYAFSQPAKKEPRPFLDIVHDLADQKGHPALPPAKGRKRGDRLDAPEVDFMTLYGEMVKAANAGNVRRAVELVAQAQKLNEQERFVIASLLETAAMYALEGATPA